VIPRHATQTRDNRSGSVATRSAFLSLHPDTQKFGRGREAMPYVEAAGAKLYFEESGYGYPIIFIHEFASDIRG
jgi:hypothetical protein